jgi:hypothetical protein
LTRTSFLVSGAMKKRTMRTMSADRAVHIHLDGALGNDCSRAGIALLCKDSNVEDLRKVHHPLWTSDREDFIRDVLNADDQHAKISARFFHYICAAIECILRKIFASVLQGSGPVTKKDISAAMASIPELQVGCW